jgi:hypothetical protein
MMGSQLLHLFQPAGIQPLEGLGMWGGEGTCRIKLFVPGLLLLQVMMEDQGVVLLCLQSWTAG